MSGITEIDGTGYETERMMSFRHSGITNRVADYSRLVSATVAGVGLAIEDTKVLSVAAGVYVTSLATQIAKGYLGRDCEYLMATGLRDGLAGFSGFIAGGALSREKSFIDLGVERLTGMGIISSASTFFSHLSSRRDLKTIEERLRLQNPPLL